MKRLNKFFFVVGSSITLAVIAMLLSRFFIPDNVGLAGGAIVMFYGLGGLIFGLALGIILIKKLQYATIKKLNYLFLLVLILVIIRIGYLISLEDKTEAPALPPKTSAAVSDYSPTNSDIPNPDVTAEVKLDRNIGIGMAKAIVSTKNTIELYKGSGGKSYSKLKFKMGKHGIEYANAPKGFNPAHNKLDYNILFFKIVDQTAGFVEAEINKDNNQTAWISKEDIRFLPWSDFLFTVHSIEPTDWENNPIRTRPERSAEPMLDINDSYILQPLKIQSEWIQVRISDQNYNAISTGWFRWKSDKELLLNYSLLS
ncbi:MAG: hypothetical protein HKN09_08370 [Saprospiraceae bacterium]|nr:hypothetical protein [Saprospiraceae bacterium]